MADDRMYLKSKISGVRICLATNHGAGGWIAVHSVGDKLYDLFSEYDNEFNDDPHGWEIEFESDCGSSECKSHETSISEEEQKRYARSFEKCIKEKQEKGERGCFDCQGISYHSVPPVVDKFPKEK